VEHWFKQTGHSDLDPSDRVDTVWDMGTATRPFRLCPRLSRFAHTVLETRGLFCGQLLARVLHPLTKATVARHLPAHFVHAMNHRRVVSSAEGLADLDQLHLQQLPREVHRDLTRHGQGFDPSLGAEALGRYAPATGHHLLDLINGRHGTGRRQAIFARGVREVLSRTDGLPVDLGIENHGIQGNDPAFLEDIGVERVVTLP